MSTTVLLENSLPVVKQNGLNTNKTVTLGGAANLDMSGSSGQMKFPTGGVIGSRPNVISGSGATVTLTAAQSGSVVLFDRAAGIIFTLPAPAVGLRFTFLVTTTVTSNNAKVITDAGTTLLTGTLLVTKAADGTSLATFGNGTNHIAVTQNGTTTGGVVGTQFEAVCTSATTWNVFGFANGSGTIATPFATS